MSLPPFHYLEPTSLKDACRLLAENRDVARIIAGGTDLLVKMKRGALAPTVLISLSNVEELVKEKGRNGGLGIGACQSISNIIKSKKILTLFPALACAAQALGSPQIRNLATIGGNLVSARPSADMAPPLIAYDASVVLRGTSNEREVRLDDFFIGPSASVMREDEILSEIELKEPALQTGCSFIKFGTRKALQISVVNVATLITLDPGKNRITSARIVLGAVAPTPMRAKSAETVLVEERPSIDIFGKAASLAAQECSPIDDLRGSAAYRRSIVKVLTKRCLVSALQDART